MNPRSRQSDLSFLRSQLTRESALAYLTVARPRIAESFDERSGLVTMWKPRVENGLTQGMTHTRIDVIECAARIQWSEQYKAYCEAQRERHAALNRREDEERLRALSDAVSRKREELESSEAELLACDSVPESVLDTCLQHVWSQLRALVEGRFDEYSMRTRGELVVRR